MQVHPDLDAFRAFADAARLHYFYAAYDADPRMTWGIWFFGQGPHMSRKNFVLYRVKKVRTR